eukprot:2528323-Ditylum_brightwellii.AAC.1
MRSLLSHRRVNFKSGKRISLSHPSWGRQVDVTEAKAKKEGERTPVVSKKPTNKAEQLQHLSSRT